MTPSSLYTCKASRATVTLLRVVCRRDLIESSYGRLQYELGAHGAQAATTDWVPGERGDIARGDGAHHRFVSCARARGKGPSVSALVSQGTYGERCTRTSKILIASSRVEDEVERTARGGFSTLHGLCEGARDGAHLVSLIGREWGA